ncbi:hypothetical protein FB45DRAFT_898992, partial [Roridomyces roridus]
MDSPPRSRTRRLAVSKSTSESVGSGSGSAPPSPSSRRPRPRSPPSMYIAYETAVAKAPKPLIKLEKKQLKGKAATDPGLLLPRPRSTISLRLSLRRKTTSETETATNTGGGVGRRRVFGKELSPSATLLADGVYGSVAAHQVHRDGTSTISSLSRTCTIGSASEECGCLSYGGHSNPSLGLGEEWHEEREMEASGDDLLLGQANNNDTSDAAASLVPMEFARASTTGIDLVSALGVGESGTASTPKDIQNSESLPAVPDSPCLDEQKPLAIHVPDPLRSISTQARAPDCLVPKGSGTGTRQPSHVRSTAHALQESVLIRTEKNENGWGWTGEWNRRDIGVVREQLRSLTL